MSCSFSPMTLLLVATLACIMTSVLSAHVSPAVPLSQMEVNHACLFICNICFPIADELMNCSNEMCEDPADPRVMDKLFWLKSNCKNYDMLQSVW